MKNREKLIESISQLQTLIIFIGILYSLYPHATIHAILWWWFTPAMIYVINYASILSVPEFIWAKYRDLIKHYCIIDGIIIASFTALVVISHSPF